MLASARPPRLHSYVVRYDSGFAPNPFYGYCTLATCKPDIRKAAQVGDWLAGCASASQQVRRGGRLVYAMRVSETLTFGAYWSDPRFQRKKPIRNGSFKQSCGDNIYFRESSGRWSQLDSFHSQTDGSPNPKHIARDTGTDRVLVGSEYYYYGGHGPLFPAYLRNFQGIDVCHSGRGRSAIDNQELIAAFAAWCRSFDGKGYLAAPWDWGGASG